MKIDETQFASTAVDHLAGIIVDLVERHVPADKAGQRSRNEVQLMFVGLGNLAGMAGRDDLRALLHEVSDKVGGKVSV